VSCTFRYWIDLDNEECSFKSSRLNGLLGLAGEDSTGECSHAFATTTLINDCYH
jgi:hypothetical protein